MPTQEAFLSDPAVAARILDHVRNGTTDEGDEVWREPVANYQSQERFEREIEVMRRTPTPFCPSAALPDPGSYIAREAAGTPVIVVRGRDRCVRAFRNACRHRGMALVDGSGCASAFVCPYHAWSYRLDGKLQHVPHERGFPGLEKEDHGLVPIAVEERQGLVYLTQGERLPAGTPPWERLPELFSPGQVLIEVREFETPVNWKIYLEGFIEGYHIRPTHPESFYPYGYDNLNVVELCGPNSRITYPFRRIEKLADVPPEERKVDGLLTYVYHLFPNAVVTILSRHTNLVVLEPIAVDRTRFITYSFANLGQGVDLESVKRDAKFVTETGAAEDQAVVEAIQRSMGSGANEFYTFGRFEACIAHFHRTLRGALADCGGEG